MAKQVFETNAKWWKTPGSTWEKQIFITGTYDRDQILDENPVADLLIELNQYVMTFDSQSDHFQEPLNLSAWLSTDHGSKYMAFLIKRCPSMKQLDQNDEKAETITTQKFYIQFLAKDFAQAASIASAIDSKMSWSVVDETAIYSNLPEDLKSTMDLSIEIFRPSDPKKKRFVVKTYGGVNRKELYDSMIKGFNEALEKNGLKSNQPMPLLFFAWGKKFGPISKRFRVNTKNAKFCKGTSSNVEHYSKPMTPTFLKLLIAGAKM